MLFGTGRMMQYITATPQGPDFGTLGLVASASLPTGSQVGDICIHHVTRSVTSEGTRPTGFNLVHGEALGAIGYVAWYVKTLTSSDITAGAVTGGATTNITQRWTWVTRPSAAVSGYAVERLETADGSASVFPKLTQAGTITRPTIVLANALNLGVTLTTKVDITPSVNKTVYNPSGFNSVAFDLVGNTDDNSARSTNQPRTATENNYFMILVSVRPTYA